MGLLSRLTGRPHLHDDRDRHRQLADLEQAALRLAAHHAQVDPDRAAAWTALAERAAALRAHGWSGDELKELSSSVPPHGLPHPRAEVELTSWQVELDRLLHPAYEAVGSLRAIGER